MIKLSDLASELNLSDHEVRAVCTMAGVTVSPATSFLDDADAQKVRDVLSGRVDVKPPRARPVVPTGRVLLIVLVVVVVGGAIAALGAIANQPASITVRPGDCFDEPDVFAVNMHPVPCSGAHKYRAYAKMDLTAKWDEYPGREIAEAHVRSRCEALRGDAGSDSFGGFQVYYFLPEERAWRNGARSAVCATRD